MRPRFPTHNDALFEQLSPFVIAPSAALAAIDPAPCGLRTRWHIDPLVAANGPFFRLLQRLDQLTFGPEGMPMDRWVFYECAELPGAIYGFALPASDLCEREGELMRVPDDYAGPVPLSIYIAIPMRTAGGGPRTFFGHNLASLNRVLPERRLSHLGSITKALGLVAFRAERSFGATQWTSAALYIHTKFGPLELATAWTPAHSIPQTLTYCFDVSELAIRAAAGDPSAEPARPPPERWVAADDEAAMQSLQDAIEDGRRFVICGPAELRDGGRRFHPIASR
jgi:hypothetical protein